jgi:hypothetical protein
VTHEMTIALSAAGVLQLLLLAQLWRTTRAAARGGRRIGQLTSALELLTDTTESGFVNVAAELTRVGARPMAPSTTRRATTRRIAEAMRQGRTLAEVAASEGVSESEVRLHLGLVGSERLATAPSAPASRPDPGVLEDLERWMSTLTSAPSASGGARHAAVRL